MVGVPVPPPAPYVAYAHPGYAQATYTMPPIAAPLAAVPAPVSVSVPATTPILAVASVPAAVGSVASSVAAEGEEDPSVKKNIVSLYGSDTTFYINSLLYQTIVDSDYYRALGFLTEYHDFLEEMKVVKNVEPWQPGTSRLPSSAFCILLKLFTMKLTYKQLNGLLNKVGSPLIRAIGFLYLRYATPPADLWKWFEPYLEDSEEIHPSADPKVSMTIGDYIISLLKSMDYFNTKLPRIPVPIERKIQVFLLLFEEKKKRRASNLSILERRGKDLAKDEKVRAIYSDEENAPAWYDAVIDGKDDSSEHKYFVVFPEYGNRESVDLGEIDLSDGKETSKAKASSEPSSKASSDDKGKVRSQDRSQSRSRSRSRDRRDKRDSRDRNRHRDRSRDRSRDRRHDRRSRSNSRSRKDKSEDTEDYMAKVLQSSREASLAVGKNYGQRPASYKGSLSLKLDRHTTRKASPERSSRRSRSRSPHRGKSNAAPEPSSSSSKSSTVSQEQLDRMKKLKERYGVASSSNQ